MREIKFRFYCGDSDTLSKAFAIEELANGKDTEIECILKACEWILSEINK